MSEVIHRSRIKIVKEKGPTRKAMIEGFFETCRAKGLNGKQGVLIPESNIKNLMLKHELVASIELGKFHIYPVKTIDEGIEVLTGIKAGKRRKDGSFEPNSINDCVQKSLVSLAGKLRDFGKTNEGVAISKKRNAD